MDFIKVYIAENISTLTQNLSDAGFSVEQATDFLPEVTPNIKDAFNDANSEHVISSDPSELLSSINIDEIADNLGISREQVASGLEIILPDIQKQIMPFSYIYNIKGGEVKK